MQAQTKALYNLLRLNVLTESAEGVEPWQIEDLRKVKEEEIFSKLASLGLSTDKEKFLLYAHECDSPEELTDCLLVDENLRKKHDQIYLLLFELWRRNLPDQASLSIFCDELDHLISLYLQGELENDELIQDGIANLLEILDENSDIGQEPAAIFSSILQYCAYDLEAFLYEYIFEQIEAGNGSYASELIEGFYPYMSDLKRFDFLRVCLLASKDIAEVNEILRTIIKDLGKKKDLPFQWDLLEFMEETGDPELFVKIVTLTLDLLTKEGQWKDLLEISSDFCGRLDRDEEEKQIQEILRKRSSISRDAHFSLEDRDVDLFKKILQAN
jgi:hypothetical protein